MENEQSTTTEQEQAVPVHPFYDKEKHQKYLTIAILSSFKNAKLVKDTEHNVFYCLFCVGKPVTHDFIFEHDGNCPVTMAQLIDAGPVN